VCFAAWLRRWFKSCRRLPKLIMIGGSGNVLCPPATNEIDMPSNISQHPACSPALAARLAGPPGWPASRMFPGLTAERADAILSDGGHGPRPSGAVLARPASMADRAV
jgi:hypothetical protein